MLRHFGLSKAKADQVPRPNFSADFIEKIKTVLANIQEDLPPGATKEVADINIAALSTLNFDLLEKCNLDQQTAVAFIIAHQLSEILICERAYEIASQANQACEDLLSEIKQSTERLLHLINNIKPYASDQAEAFLPSVNQFISSLELKGIALKMDKHIPLGLAAAIAHCSDLRPSDSSLLQLLFQHIEPGFKAIISCEDNVPSLTIIKSVVTQKRDVTYTHEGIIPNPFQLLHCWKLGKASASVHSKKGMFVVERQKTTVNKYLINLQPSIKAQPTITIQCIIMMMFSMVFRDSFQKLSELMLSQKVDSLFTEQRSLSKTSYFSLLNHDIARLVAQSLRGGTVDQSCVNTASPSAAKRN